LASGTNESAAAGLLQRLGTSTEQVATVDRYYVVEPAYWFRAKQLPASPDHSVPKVCVSMLIRSSEESAL